MGEADYSWVLTTMMPILGMILVWTLSITPIKTIMEAEKKGTLGEFNPYPNVVFAGQCVIYTIFGLGIKNPYVSITNTVGLGINLYMVLRCHRLAQPKDRVYMEVLGGLLFTIAAGLWLASLWVADFFALANIIGWVGTVIATCVWLASLIKLGKVFRERDSAPIHLPWAIASLLTASCWTAYGFAVPVYQLAVSQGVGVISSIIQLTVRLIIPVNTNKDLKESFLPSGAAVSSHA